MLSIEDVTFGYEPARPILTNWAADFGPGEIVAITGPSGRGKSTLLYLLGLMLAPDKGRVLIDGDDVTRLRDREKAHLRADLYGFVFQDAALDSSRTVLANVIETALYRGQSRRTAIGRAEALLEHFGVALRADAKPGQVSGGQAQRIALCRALLNAPRFLLADEPTGNLDPASSSVVIQAFRDHAASGSTVIIVTHDPHLVDQCDRSVQL